MLQHINTMLLVRETSKLHGSKYAKQLELLLRIHRRDRQSTLDDLYKEDRKAQIVLLVQKDLIGIGRIHQNGLIDMVHVAQRYRKKGYGTQILQRLLDLHPRPHLEVERSNVAAISLYRSAGFKVSRSYKSHGMDLYRMVAY